MLRSLGSVKGRLILNSGKYELHPIPDEVVQLEFSGEIEPPVGKKLMIYGECVFQESKGFPLSVEVHSFDILPEDSELPSLLDLKGCLEGISDIDSVDMQRQLREEWEHRTT